MTVWIHDEHGEFHEVILPKSLADYAADCDSMKELGSLVANHDNASVMRDWSNSDLTPGAPSLTEYRTIDDFFSGSQNPFFLPSFSSADKD